MDGNEKLRDWGFWIHGGIDGHSRYIAWLECRSNKTAKTVKKIFVAACKNMGHYPSRVRGDYGTENNGVEKFMIALHGELHRPFIRGRYVMVFYIMIDTDLYTM